MTHDDARITDGAAPPAADDETSAALTPLRSGYTFPAQPVPEPPAGATGERLRVHAAWELMLLVLLVGGIGLWWLFGGDTDLLRDPALLGERLYAVAPFLLLATALAISLRVRAVNLAVAAVATLAAVLFLEWERESQLVAVGLVAAAALATGGVLSVLVIWLRIPGWAASLGAVVAVTATSVTVAPSVGGLLGAVPESATVTTAEELVWVVVLAVMAVSVLGGVVGVLPAVRRRLQACREAAESPDRRTGSAALTTAAALLASSLLAAAAGVLLLIPSESGAGGIQIPLGALESLGLALPLAIVLLGGTSVRGKRGGVFGTLLAATAMFAGFVAFDELGWNDQSQWITVAALALGFLVSALVELPGTRRPARLPDPPTPAPVAAAPDEPPVPVTTGVAG